jgi:hypothetical protein
VSRARPASAGLVALLVAASVASCGGGDSTVTRTFTIQRNDGTPPTSTDRQPGQNGGNDHPGDTTSTDTTSTATTSTQTSTGSSGGTSPASPGDSSGSGSGGTSPGDAAREYCNTHPGACD